MQSIHLLGQEWHTLQNNHEQHEKNALTIKLICLALSLAGLAFGLPSGWIAVVVLLCWLQEGIFKTYQSRLSGRLLRVELLIRQAHLPGQAPESSPQAMQLHSEWLESRLTGVRLLAGYVTSACRPTVAFPYVPMLLIGWLADLV